MARKFLTPIDLAGNQLLNAEVQNVTSLPVGLTSSNAGQMVYLTTSGRYYIWNGSAWDLTATSSDLLNGALDSAGHAGAYYQARANHSGTQTSSTISDLAATVHAYTLDSFATPAASVAFGSQRATGLADPTSAQDAATRNYVDSALSSLSSGMVLKGAVICAPTTNVNTSSPGATLDTVALSGTPIVLLTGQTTASQNGPWQWNGAAVAMTRPTNFATSAQAQLGSFWIVEQGANADTFGVMTNDAAVTLGTTALTFTFRGNSGSSVTAGNGLTGTSSFSVLPASGGGVSVSGSGVAVDTTVARKFTGAIPATTSGAFSVSGAAVTINHALNNSAPKIEVRYYTSPGSGNTQGAELEVENVASDGNNIVVTLPAAPLANQYFVSIIG